MTTEEKEDWKNCRNRMNEEGFHFCFSDYSDFEEIKDEEFHKLRLNYLAAAKSLEEYIEKKAEE